MYKLENIVWEISAKQNKGIKIAEKSIAKCNDCELNQNLWLCLTCGNLSCGRKETGGNAHAIEHYNKTKHPLVVKTGTITPNGEASIYCYACDNDVKDENYIIPWFLYNWINVPDSSKPVEIKEMINVTNNALRNAFNNL